MSKLSCFKKISIYNDQITEEENPTTDKIQYLEKDNSIEFKNILFSRLTKEKSLLKDLLFLFDPQETPSIVSSFYYKNNYFSIISYKNEKLIQYVHKKNGIQCYYYKSKLKEEKKNESNYILKEKPSLEKKEIVEEKPTVEEKEIVEEKPNVEEKEKVEEKPTVEEKEKVEEKHTIEEKEKVEEKPTVEEKEKVEEKPTVEEKEIVKEKPSLEKKEKVEEKPSLEKKEKVEEKHTVVQPLDIKSDKEMKQYVQKIVHKTVKNKINDFLFPVEEENEKYNEKFLKIIAQNLDNGKGIFFHPNGKKKYEGTFKNGKLEGKGKYYFSNEKLRYEGAFKNGLYEGKGTEYYGNNIKYSGQFKEGKKYGKGCIYKDGILLFEGKWII